MDKPCQKLWMRVVAMESSRGIETAYAYNSKVALTMLVVPTQCMRSLSEDQKPSKQTCFEFATIYA